MVKLLSAKIRPKFMKGAILYHPNPDKINYSEIMVIRNSPTNKYIFATSIIEVKKSSDEEIIIHVDKNKSNSIQDKETIQILEYNIPHAEYVTIYLKNSTSVPNGNWGNMLSEQFLNNVFDSGEDCYFIYPSKNPIMLSGVIKNSLPNAPIKITENTNFIIEKIDTQEMFNFRVTVNSNINSKVNEYMQYIKNNSFDIIAAIKNDETQLANHAYKLEADANNIIKGIRIIFKNWNLQKENIFNEDNSVNAGFDFTYEVNHQVDAFCEVHLFSQNDIGDLTIKVYTLESDPKEYLKRILDDIALSISSSKFRNTTIDDNCPGCGLKFDISNVNEDGFIRCSACQELIQLSAKYRYQ